MSLGIRVGGNYYLGKKIGNGAFGDIHIGINIKDDTEVAIKLVQVPNLPRNQLKDIARNFSMKDV
jgi:hypothetical protein